MLKRGQPKVQVFFSFYICRFKHMQIRVNAEPAAFYRCGTSTSFTELDQHVVTFYSVLLAGLSAGFAAMENTEIARRFSLYSNSSLPLKKSRVSGTI